MKTNKMPKTFLVSSRLVNVVVEHQGFEVMFKRWNSIVGSFVKCWTKSLFYSFQGIRVRHSIGIESNREGLIDPQ